MDMGEKYRPDTLDGVAGQGVAVAQIKRALERSGWTGSCWWLYGASGTGKTTIARIIAGMEAQEHSTREFVGRDLSVDDCRAMMDTIPCSSMFGGAVLLRMLGREVEADTGGAYEYCLHYCGGDRDQLFGAVRSLINRTVRALDLIIEEAGKLAAVAA